MEHVSQVNGILSAVRSVDHHIDLRVLVNGQPSFLTIILIHPVTSNRPHRGIL